MNKLAIDGAQGLPIATLENLISPKKIQIQKFH